MHVGMNTTTTLLYVMLVECVSSACVGVYV